MLCDAAIAEDGYVRVAIKVAQVALRAEPRYAGKILTQPNDGEVFIAEKWPIVCSGDKSEWYKIIQLLPSGYNQLRTCTMSYENLVNMYNARKSHKLHEWREFCDWITTLPYAIELICCCSK
jgi:hypothetical protein